MERGTQASLVNIADSAGYVRGSSKAARVIPHREDAIRFWRNLILLLGYHYSILYTYIHIYCEHRGRIAYGAQTASALRTFCASDVRFVQNFLALVTAQAAADTQYNTEYLPCTSCVQARRNYARPVNTQYYLQCRKRTFKPYSFVL